MAKTTDANLTWHGSQFNERQMKLGIPGGPAANSGGLLYIERVTSGAAADSGIWLHTDGTNLLYTASATAPVDTNSGTSLGGADTALSNLASVQIPNAGDLIPATTNQVDIGTTSAQFKNAWFDGTVMTDDLESDAANFGRTQGSGSNYLKVAASGVVTTEGTSTINGITLTNNSNEIKMTKGTASFEIAAGDTDLIIGAAGSLDVAAAIDVNIDQHLTIAGGALTTSAACTIDQNLAAAQSPTWVGLTLTGAIATPTTITASSYITTSGDVRITSDTNRLELGAGASDSYIKFDGTNLLLQDSTSGEFTLAELSAGTPLNPIVTGDFTISDGEFDWVNTSTSDTNTWDFGATTVDTFDIVCDNSTAAFLDIEADSFTAHGTAAEGLIDINVDGITSGNVFVIDTAQGGTFTGSYLKFYTDGSTDAFTVKGYGATTIAGVNNVTAALTLTAGKLVLTDGWIDSDISNIAATGHNFATAANATATIPLMTLTASDAAFDLPILFLDSRATGDVNCLEIDNYGTGFGVSIDLANKTDAEGLEIIFDTGSTDDGIFLDGNTGTYLGSSGTGMIHMHQTGTFAATDSSCLFIDVDGTTQSGGEGYALLIDDDSTSGGAADVAVYINTLDGVPLKLEGQATDQNTLRIEAGAAQAVPAVYIDGATNDWDGNDNIGMLHLTSDTALADNGSTLLYINSSTSKDGAEGSLARLLDTSAAAGGGTTYAVEISSTNNEALKVSAGLSTFAAAVTVGTTLGVTGATTFTLGQQSAAVARTSGDGTGTAAIADGTTYVTTTSGNAANWFKLPTPTPGNVVWMGPNATGHEVRSSAPASVAINGGTGATAESAVGANVTVRFVCTSSTTWVATTFAANGTEAALEAAA